MKAHMPFPRRGAPPLARAVQNLPAEHIADPRREVRRMLLARGLRLKAGARVAITAGSRGVGGFVPLLAGIADAVKEAGGEPFLIPAMGSHGGATPEGQTEILGVLGATEEAVGAPVRATMETIALGAAENGAVAHLDKIAQEADGIIVFGRTKTHPESAHSLASGLLKMVTVGLGKQAGAQQAHNHGLWESVRLVPEITMARAKVLYGVALVENAYRQPYRIEVVEPTYEAFLESDKRLLEVAKTRVAEYPLPEARPADRGPVGEDDFRHRHGPERDREVAGDGGPARAGFQAHCGALAHGGLAGQRFGRGHGRLHHAALDGCLRPRRDLRQPADGRRARRQHQRRPAAAGARVGPRSHRGGVVLLAGGRRGLGFAVSATPRNWRRCGFPRRCSKRRWRRGCRSIRTRARCPMTSTGT